MTNSNNAGFISIKIVIIINYEQTNKTISE